MNNKKNKAMELKNLEELFKAEKEKNLSTMFADMRQFKMLAEKAVNDNPWAKRGYIDLSLEVKDGDTLKINLNINDYNCEPSEFQYFEFNGIYDSGEQQRYEKMTMAFTCYIQNAKEAKKPETEA